jgi:hypothetical protein
MIGPRQAKTQTSISTVQTEMNAKRRPAARQAAKRSVSSKHSPRFAGPYE